MDKEITVKLGGQRVKVTRHDKSKPRVKIAHSARRRPERASKKS